MGRNSKLLLALAVWSIAGGPALAADAVLTKAEATPLTEDNIGKPLWSLEAQCAGVYGAGYAYERARGNDERAEADKNAGVAILESAVTRLQLDRGVDRATAMSQAEPDVEYGRATGKAMLDRSGSDARSDWNIVRSACVDLAEVAHNHGG
jgi:hypothetical protein